jgi:hypothetical protein
MIPVICEFVRTVSPRTRVAQYTLNQNEVSFVPEQWQAYDLVNRGGYGPGGPIARILLVPALLTHEPIENQY